MERGGASRCYRGVAGHLRSAQGTADALLIALTGYGQADDREKAAAAGFDQHILNPAEPAEYGR